MPISDKMKDNIPQPIFSDWIICHMMQSRGTHQNSLKANWTYLDGDGGVCEVQVAIISVVYLCYTPCNTAPELQSMRPHDPSSF